MSDFCPPESSDQEPVSRVQFSPGNGPFPYTSLQNALKILHYKLIKCGTREQEKAAV